MIDFQVAYDKLASMETADEIADFFRAEGIKGFPAQPRTCPISNWMHSTTGCRTGAAGYIYNLETWKTPEDQLTPTLAMTEFMIEFDGGRYPDLIVPCHDRIHDRI